MKHKKRRSNLDRLSLKMISDVNFLLHTLFRKLRAFGGSLTGLKFRVGLVDHVKGAFAFHNLTSCVAALH